MAEKKEEPKNEEAKGDEAKGGKKGLLAKTPVLITVAMVLEAVVLIGAVKFMGGSTTKSADAAAVIDDEEGDAEKGDDKGDHGSEKAAGGNHGGGSGGGDHGAAAGGKKLKGNKDVEITKFRAPNTQTGRRYIYEVEVFASVKIANVERVEAVLKNRKATVEDRIRTIIAQSDPDKLSAATEPGLETLRRQVKHEIEALTGEGSIQEIVIPRCIPFRGD